MNTSRIGGKTPAKERSAFGYYNHQKYLNDTTSAQKRKSLNATQTFSSSRLGIKPSKSKSALQRPKVADESEINETLLQEKNISNINTAVDLLTVACKK